MAVAFRLVPSFASSSYSVTRSAPNLPFCTPLQSVISAAAASQHTLAATSNFTWDDVVCILLTSADSSIKSPSATAILRSLNLYRLWSKSRSLDTFTTEGSSYGGNFGCYLALHPILNTPEDRTEAVAHVVKCLSDEHIPGIRNELYPVVSSFGTPEFFSLERAAAPYFGIKAYGVHMNGHVERDHQGYLWVGKRSETKSKYPGMLDHLVAGGLPHGITCGENIVKECKEEAGIPSSVSSKATAVGAVTYSDIDGYRFNRDVLFCYDLKLPEDFVPRNEDGEVGSFKLLPVEHVANIIRSTNYFKTNCNLVIIDFLFRHGYINPEAPGYLKLLRSLRSGDCT